MRRGEIWWADLPHPRASEPGYRRPVLIVQSDVFNRSKLRTVIVAAITSNLRLAGMPGNVALPKRSSGLSLKSVVNVSQVTTIDRSLLSERERALPEKLMRQVDEGLMLVLGLPPAVS